LDVSVTAHTRCCGAFQARRPVLPTRMRQFAEFP
jgi:hypothetical protein